MRRGSVVLLGLSLAACGSQERLKPPAGQAPPPRAVGALSDPTPEQLITPDGQARPIRSDGVLNRSEQRRDDPFDLPPQE